MRLALFCALGALHTCLAFRPKARPAWEGVEIVKQVTYFTRHVNTVVAHILSFAKALLEAFDASGEGYKPVGTGAYDCGKLARYLKDVLEGALAVPAFAGNDKLVFEFLQGLSATDKNTLWRAARWYNHLVELTLPEDEEEEEE